MKKLITLGLICIFALGLGASFAFAGGQKEEKAEGAESAEEPYEIVYVAKLIGIPWFNATEDGMKAMAKKLGVKASVVGPPDPDPAQQARVVEDMIAKGVDAICAVPNEADTLEPVLKKAQEAGILVLTHESTGQKNNDYDIEMVDNVKLGELHAEKLAELIGGEGGYGVLVGGLSVPTHNEWADAAIAYQEENYPDMYQVTDRLPGTESVEESHDRVIELMKAYPDLKGVLCFGSLGPIGAAQAVKEKGMEDEVAIVGTALPSHAEPYLKDGSMDCGYLYSPVDCGEAVVFLSNYLLEGNKIEDLDEIPDVGTFTLDGKIIVVDGIVEITAENAGSLGF